MNNITNKVHQLKNTREIKLKIDAPGACIYCGMNPEDMKKEYGVAWMMFQIPDTTIIFFQCPHCNGLMGNPYAVENTKKIMQEREEDKDIVTPSGKLWLPGMGNN